MAKRTLNDRIVKTLRPAKATSRYVVMDAAVPGFGVRVTDKGVKTYILVARYPGSKNPTRRAVAAVGAISLADAREKAREWLAQLRAGTDPRHLEAEAREATRAAAGNVFAMVAERCIERQLKAQRRGHVVERIIRKELLPSWKDRPIGRISHRDVREIIDKVIERGAKVYAHNVFDAIRTVFSFAVSRGILDTSPCDAISRTQLIGNKTIRTRVLDDRELCKLWKAAGALGFPFGPMTRALMLTGCRLNEVARARWCEFDLPNRIWTIPAERFKSNAQHLVPLSDDMLALLESLPRFTKGDHLFSTTYGVKPVAGLSKPKHRLDEQMGDIPGWVFHDIRRTVRTKFAELRIPDSVVEMVIGHAPRGLARIYNQHRYLDEAREALSLWGVRLRSIVEPPPANVVSLEKARA